MQAKGILDDPAGDRQAARRLVDRASALLKTTAEFKVREAETAEVEPRVFVLHLRLQLLASQVSQLDARLKAK